jgi:hypothetical protein
VQNTVVKEFEGNPRVVAAAMSQLATPEMLETFWRNLYLRGPMINDPSGNIAGVAYAQPDTGVSFGRSFIIGPDQCIVLPLFGHDPQRVIDTIYGVLAAMSPPGDLNCDGSVNNFDITPFVLALVDTEGYAAAYPHCDRILADVNGDGHVDNFDITPFVGLLVGD